MKRFHVLGKEGGKTPLPIKTASRIIAMGCLKWTLIVDSGRNTNRSIYSYFILGHNTTKTTLKLSLGS